MQIKELIKSSSKINLGDLVKLCGFHYHNPDDPSASVTKNKLWIVTDVEITKHDTIMLTVENFGNHDNIEKTSKRIIESECILMSRSENHDIID